MLFRGRWGQLEKLGTERYTAEIRPFRLLALIYGVIMPLPRRAQMMLGALGMVLLFGILGLAW